MAKRLSRLPDKIPSPRRFGSITSTCASTGQNFTAVLHVAKNVMTIRACAKSDDGQLGRNKAVMVLASPFGLADLPDQFRLELDFFRFPTIDPSLSQGEVVPSIGYMIPSAATNRLAAMDLVAYLSSAEAQTTIFQPRGSLPTFVPASSEVLQDNFSQEIQRGMAIVQGASGVTPQYFWSNPSTMQSIIVTTMRTFVRAAQSDSADIDNLLLKLEDARQTAVTEQAFAVVLNVIDRVTDY